jgi:hypothetical protein
MYEDAPVSLPAKTPHRPAPPVPPAKLKSSRIAARAPASSATSSPAAVTSQPEAEDDIRVVGEIDGRKKTRYLLPEKLAIITLAPGHPAVSQRLIWNLSS